VGLSDAVLYAVLHSVVVVVVVVGMPTEEDLVEARVGDGCSKQVEWWVECLGS